NVSSILFVHKEIVSREGTPAEKNNFPICKEPI
ncbi:hypothetical protein VSAK1_19359, partial [Vibrio mediterranei AK1]